MQTTLALQLKMWSWIEWATMAEQAEQQLRVEEMAPLITDLKLYADEKDRADTAMVDLWQKSELEWACSEKRENWSEQKS